MCSCLLHKGTAERERESERDSYGVNDYMKWDSQSLLAPFPYMNHSPTFNREAFVGFVASGFSACASVVRIVKTYLIYVTHLSCSLFSLPPLRFQSMTLQLLL